MFYIIPTQVQKHDAISTSENAKPKSFDFLSNPFENKSKEFNAFVDCP